MIITNAKLAEIRVGFNKSFQDGLGQAPSQWERVATRFNSTTLSNNYGWLGDLPGFRKWVGDRVIKGLKEYNYQLENEDYEETIGVDRNAIEDDNLGIYGARFEGMGRSAGRIKDQLVFAALLGGFSTNCYDGQFFFDTDHPVLDKNGKETTVANTDGGSGEPWFLIDSKQPINPIILQIRKEVQMVSKDSPNDDNVFMQKKFLYGADCRMVAGYGFWQWSWGSKQTLDSAHYATARAALTGMKGDHGAPIGIMPDLLVVGPANEQKARQLLLNKELAGGGANEWAGTAELLVVPWLA